MHIILFIRRHNVVIVDFTHAFVWAKTFGLFILTNLCPYIRALRFLNINENTQIEFNIRMQIHRQHI